MNDGNAGLKTATHNDEPSGFGMFMTAAAPVTNGYADPLSTAWITFDFGQIVNNLDETLVWNFNQNAAAGGFGSGRSMRQVDITYSVNDATGLGNVLYDNLILTRAFGTPNLAFTDDLALGVSGTGISARAVRITVDGGLGVGNYNDGSGPYYGLSEVRFYRVPEPTSAVLLGFGLLCGLFFAKRRKM